jgi:methionyl-tRNA formyltransferase
MRVYFILDDTVFYHPQMLDAILSSVHYEWCGVALVKAKHSLDGYFLKHAFDIGFVPGAKLCVRKYKALIMDKLKASREPLTVKAAAQKHNIDYVFCRDIHSADFLDYLQTLNIDVIVSSNPQIFGKKLLAIPKIACINQHSALLPAHGGILPVFQAIAAGDAFTGVTIHKMDKTIDTGTIITQKAIPIPEKPVLSDLYKECFELSAELILQALEILGKDLPFITLAEPARKQSYHSFPNKDDWARFKKRKGIFA